MNPRVWKALASIALSVSMIVGCGAPQNTEPADQTGNGEVSSTAQVEETEESTTQAQEEDLSDYYAMTLRTLSTSDGIRKYSIQDEKIIAAGYKNDAETRTTSYYITSWKEDENGMWQEQEQIPLPFTSSKTSLICCGLDMDENDVIHVLYEDRSNKHLYLVKIDAEGQVVENIDIITMLPEGCAITNMTVGVGGFIFLEDTVEQVAYKLTTEGEYIGSYKVEDGGMLWDLPKNNDDEVILISRKRNQLYMSKLVEGETFAFQTDGKEIDVTDYMGVYEGIDNKMFVNVLDGLYSYDYDTQLLEMVIDWSLFGIDYKAVDYVGVMDGETDQEITVICETEFKNQTSEIYTFVKSDNAQKEKLILATLGIHSRLRTEVTTYNRTHPEYPIKIKEYPNDIEGLRQLNTDLLSGAKIDMIDVRSISHLTSLDYYVEQGLLEDIGARMKEDPTIDETDLLESVLEANKIDGVLYNLVPSFTIETFSGAKSVVGDDFVWTVEEALDVMLSENCMYSIQNKEQFLRDICRYNGDYLVNEEEGTCHFDSEAFIALLTYANTLVDYSKEEWSGNSRWDTFFEQSDILLQEKQFEVELEAYRRAKGLLRDGVAKDEVTFVGFPMIDENETVGSAFFNIISVAMVSTSQNKDIAWGFFQYLLSDTYQNDERAQTMGNPFVKDIGFPLKKSVIQNRMEQQLTMAAGGIKTEDFCATQEDIAVVNELLNSVTRVVWENDIIFNIIWEEAQYYFAGENTAQEAAQMMQGRVELYLMEKE